MTDLLEDELARVQRRLAALDKIEAKLKEIRELAVYAAGRSLSDEERAQVQEWIQCLESEVEAIRREEPWLEETPH